MSILLAKMLHVLAQVRHALLQKLQGQSPSGTLSFTHHETPPRLGTWSLSPGGDVENVECVHTVRRERRAQRSFGLASLVLMVPLVPIVLVLMALMALSEGVSIGRTPAISHSMKERHAHKAPGLASNLQVGKLQD